MTKTTPPVSQISTQNRQLQPTSNPQADDSDQDADDTQSLKKLSPLQQFLAMLMMLFVKNSDASSGLDGTVASILGVKDGARGVQALRQDLHQDFNKTLNNFNYAHTNFEQARTFADQNSPLPPAAPLSGPFTASGTANFDQAVRKILKTEGGLNLHEPDGAIAKFGFNSNANPGLDVRDLTVDKAMALYKKNYWDEIKGINGMSQAQALVAFDCAVNCGVATANKMTKETGGDVNKMLEWRKDYYRTLAERNPERNEKYEKGWIARVDDLQKTITNLSGPVRPTADFAATQSIHLVPSQSTEKKPTAATSTTVAPAA